MADRTAPHPLDPPHPRGPTGARRTVGVEIEFTGLDGMVAAERIQRRFGGTIAELDPHRLLVQDTSLGTFTVELDLRHAHPGGLTSAQQARQGPSGEPPFVSQLRSAWGDVGRFVMPYELTAPPIPYDRLGTMDEAAADLRQAGAQGTDAGILYAFGLHLNVEVALEDAAYLTRVLKAYLLLSPWLRTRPAIHVTRRVLPWVDAFPEAYTCRVVDPGYRPDLDTLIAEYLDANPTRNRDLDMIPLFAHLQPERVAAAIDDPHVSARPTFHYRLPDSRIGDPHWRIVDEWDRWVQVEWLAEDEDALTTLGMAYLENSTRLFPAAWPDHIDDWFAQWRGGH